MADFNLNSTFGGLGTALDFKAPTADTYAISGSLTLPGIPQGSPLASAVVVVVNKNGSPVYTGLAGAKGFKTDVVCAALDEITVVLSSALAEDNAPNAVKSTISVSLSI